MQLGCTVVAGGLGFVVGHMRALAFLYDSLGRLPDLAEKVRSATMRNGSITCDTWSSLPRRGVLVLGWVLW